MKISRLFILLATLSSTMLASVCVAKPLNLYDQPKTGAKP